MEKKIHEGRRLPVRRPAGSATGKRLQKCILTVRYKIRHRQKWNLSPYASFYNVSGNLDAMKEIL
jgi:hypothetical protein